MVPGKHGRVKNLKSVTQCPDIAKQKKNEKEISAGRVAGPFDYLPLINLLVSQVGIVPLTILSIQTYARSNILNLMTQYTWFKI